MKALTALSGLSSLTQAAASALSQGPLSPGAASSLGWADASAITASDDSRATVEVPSGEASSPIQATQFGFSIPGGSSIVGIEARLQRSKTGTGVVVNTVAQLLKAGSPVGVELTQAGDWPTSDAVQTFGGASSLWGTTWADTDVNDTGFGVLFYAEEGETDLVNLRIDHVQLTVWYQ